MAKLVIINGIPGVGKSTVIEKALEKSNKDYQIINYGTIMFENAKNRGWVKDRDELRYLSIEKQKENQKESAKKIREIANKTNVILDTHATIKTPSGYLPGLPEYVIKELMPDTIVLVEAKDEEIYNRRNKDKTRNRDEESVESIHIHQNINRAIAMSYSVLTGCTVKIVYNHDNMLDKAANELIKVL